jgi:hypothetical protein
MTLPHRGLSAYSASVREFGAGNLRSSQIWGNVTVECRSNQTLNVQSFPILVLRVSCERTVAKPVHIVRGV